MPKLSQDKELPVSVKKIRLGSALRDCGNCSFAESFDKSNAEQLYIYDDSDLGYTDWTDSEPDFVSKCFIVKNPNGIVITLLPLDGKIITGKNITQGGVCDGMILTEQGMSLIEFKTNVMTPNYLTVLQRATEAVSQLWHTFDGIIKPKCESQSVNIEELLSVDFHVVFNKDFEIMGVNAELMDLQIQFFEDNKHLLFFDYGKTF